MFNPLQNVKDQRPSTPPDPKPEYGEGMKAVHLAINNFADVMHDLTISIDRARHEAAGNAALEDATELINTYIPKLHEIEKAVTDSFLIIDNFAPEEI